MTTWTKLEDLEAWNKARELTNAVYSLTEAGSFDRDPSLRDQMRRASVSAMSNIAEGFERDGNKEFVYFLSIAKSSAGEVGSQLYVALDRRYVTRKEFMEIQAAVGTTKRLIAGLMNYLRKSPMTGLKFKALNQKPETRNR